MNLKWFVKVSMITLIFISGSSLLQAQPSVDWPKRSETWVPVTPLTKGPAYHWFGYYDKLEIDPTNRYVLGMETYFEDKSPTINDTIKVGMIDLQDNNRWIELGESRAWNWQQGCMLQWLPESNSEILWNDFNGEKFICHILDVFTGDERIIPYPVYTVSPDGKTALTLDFSRINDMRPGYGYPGLNDPNKNIMAPENSGIYKVDLGTGRRELIISVADMLEIPFHGKDISKNKHYFNHLLFSPDGSRFIFLNRWRINEYRASNPTTPFDTRMMTASIDGNDIRVVDDSGYTSHFIWRDPQHILAWTKLPSYGDRFYLFKDDGSKEGVAIGPDVMTTNGHCTYLPGNKWILNDTYPDENRLQHVFLYNRDTGEKVPLGNFLSPPEYRFDWEGRVDTHPRFSPNGRYVVIDSPHEGNGRQIYLLDINAIY